MPLRNVPERQAATLADLIELREGQVSSCALARDAGVDMTLLAPAAGEGVSEEEYFGDTLYYVVEGRAAVVLPDRRVVLRAGEAMKVAAHVLHAVECAADRDDVGSDDTGLAVVGSDHAGSADAALGVAASVPDAEGTASAASVGFKLLQITLHA